MADYREYERATTEPTPRERYERGNGADGADLKALLGRLNRDATQLAHDELALVKLEVREVAEAFTADIRQAGRTLAKDLGKVGVALNLGMLGGLALTTAAILGIGRLLGGAFWASALIVGGVLLIAAAVFAKSAATDMQESEAMRLEGGRRTLEREKDLLREEARETQRFAREEAEEFKRHASPGGEA